MIDFISNLGAYDWVSRKLVSGQKSNDSFNEDLAVSLTCLSDLACQITPAKTDGSPAVRLGVVFSKLSVLHVETRGILLFSYIISH